MPQLSKCFFLFGLIFFTANAAEAASLYIDPPRAELNRGDVIELSVRLDVDEAVQECVNAVDAVISYTENIAPVDISLGDSIFSIWVEEPVIDESNQTITFAGGMPNGYCGRVSGDPRLTNRLVTLVFRSPGFSIGGGSGSDSAAKVEFTDQTTAYLNDGLGTAVTPQTFGSSIELSSRAGSGIIDPWREAVLSDEIPPEEFSIFLEKDDRAFQQKYYISFNTTDKQTGIDQYQVIEEPIEQYGSFRWGGADAPWVVARSPYVLEDQTLNSVIRVKAIDKAGNEYIATLLPDESLRVNIENSHFTVMIYVLISCIVLACLLVVFVYLRQRLKYRKKLENHDDAEDAEGESDEDYDAEDDNESEK